MRGIRIGPDTRRSICMLLFFIALFGFMPTNLGRDQRIWMGATLLLVGNVLLDAGSRRISLFVSRSYLIYFTLIAYGALSMLWSQNVTYTVNYLLVKFPFITAGALSVCAYMYSDASSDRVYKLMVWAACIAAVRFCYYTPWSGYLRGDFGILLDPNTNYNNYTAPLCMAFIVAAYYAFGRKNRLMIIPTVWLAAVLVLAGSRKTIAVIPVILFFYLVDTQNYKRFLKGILLASLLIAVLAAAIINIDALSGIRESLQNAVNAYILGEKTNVGRSTETRIYLVDTAKQVWMEHPVFGVGWNNFRSYNFMNLYSHNNYIEVLACLGIVGFLLYYSLHAHNVFAVFSNRNFRSNIWTKLMLGALLGMLIIEVGAVSVYSRETMLLYLIILGMNDKIRGFGIRVTYMPQR